MSVPNRQGVKSPLDSFKNGIPICLREQKYKYESNGDLTPCFHLDTDFLLLY